MKEPQAQKPEEETRKKGGEKTPKKPEEKPQDQEPVSGWRLLYTGVRDK